MTMRITGMNSGLDTESIITELLKAKSVKKDNLVKSQKKLEYKQDAWKTLNSKIYSLYNKTINNLKYTSAYKQQKTTVSDSSVASVIVGKDATNGIQNLQVDSLATSGYLTGAKIGSTCTSSTTLAELANVGTDAEISFSVEVNGQSKPIKLTGASTIGDVVSELKKAGVNANFDEKNKRFFISAKATGATADFKITADAGSNGYNALTALGINEKTCIATDSTDTNGATRIKGEDAKIRLNDAVFESASNTFEINGLTITAMKTTAPKEAVTLTTADDYDSIYGTIKSFLKEYNELIVEMDKLYNADSAKGYEPLTDEEKEELSEKEAEKWEQKIKDSILRRDSTLGEVSNLMKSTMLQGFEVNGETMYLSNFGISTLGYFSSGDNEKGVFHIDGDPDDEHTMGNADKLKTMIANDPEAVVSFFTQLTNALYTELGKKMSSDDYSSFNKVYNDKQMAKDYDDYKTKIAEQEKKITAAEDKYYKQFSAMETALAKLQSKETALSGLFGG